MRGNVVTLLAVALMCVCGVARSNIVYNVNITDGTETIFGAITTDGNTGALVVGDITAWNLTATGPVALSINSTLPLAIVACTVGGCGLAATATTLAYDFSNPLTFVEFCAPCSTRIAFTLGGVFAETPTMGREIRVGEPRTIGTASAVPEPATLALLGVGLAGLGFSRRRKSN